MLLTNVITVRPSMDTVELWLPQPRAGMKHEIERTVGRKVRFTRAKVGALAQVNRPNLKKLPELESLKKKYRGSIHRYDVACDFYFATPSDADRGGEELDHLISLRWRAKNVKMELKGGVFGDGMMWVHQPGARRASRWLVRYRKGPTVQRLEIKFMNAAAVRRTGVTDLRSLADLNPQELFAHHLKLARWTDKYRDRLIREAIKELAQEGRKMSRAYHYDIARRINGMLNRQYMQDGGNRRHVETIKMAGLGIPDRIGSAAGRWPRVRG